MLKRTRIEQETTMSEVNGNTGTSSQETENTTPSNLSMQERVIQKARKMSIDERFNVLVSAGIYTSDRKLTIAYSGG
jgi:hypothetical protein